MPRMHTCNDTNHTYARPCCSEVHAMAPVYAISLVLPSGSVIAAWETAYKYTSLELLKTYVPDMFESGTYMITTDGKDVI